MNIQFQVLDSTFLEGIVGLLDKLNEGRISSDLLNKRTLEMLSQENYECIGVLDENALIGICGLWYCTRHYSGRSVEIDHVYIEESHRDKGLGKQFMDWVEQHAISEKVETIELNTYVENSKSHKFYFNQGMRVLGFHFLKNL